MNAAETDRAAVRDAIAYLRQIGADRLADAVQTLADARNVLKLTADSISAHRDKLAAANTALTAERDFLAAELVALRVDRDLVIRERNSLASRNAHLARQLSALTHLHESCSQTAPQEA